MYGLAFFFGFIILGWFLSIASRAAAHRVSGKLMVGLLLIHGAVIVSGALLQYFPALEAAHRWTSHSMLIFGWVTLPLVIGALLQRELKSRPLFAIFQSMLLLGILLLTLVCSFTGYLEPGASNDFRAAQEVRVSQETHNRFVVLHLAVLPTLLTLAIFPSCWLLNSKRWKPEQANAASPAMSGDLVDDGDNKGEPTTANPYRSPRAVD